MGRVLVARTTRLPLPLAAAAPRDEQPDVTARGCRAKRSLSSGTSLAEFGLRAAGKLQLLSGSCNLLPPSSLKLFDTSSGEMSLQDEAATLHPQTLTNTIIHLYNTAGITVCSFSSTTLQFASITRC
ncbi:hypothetical protein ABVT39_020231 [Epinephelus coioides]